MIQHIDIAKVLAIWVSIGSMGCRYPTSSYSLISLIKPVRVSIRSIILHTYSKEEKIYIYVKQQVEHRGKKIGTTDTPTAKCLILLLTRVSIGCRYSSKGFGKGIDETIPLFITGILKPNYFQVTPVLNGAVAAVNPEIWWYVIWRRGPPKSSILQIKTRVTVTFSNYN